MSNIQKPLITIKEARKQLGKVAKGISNEELSQLLDQMELLTRLTVKQYMVHKNDMVD